MGGNEESGSGSTEKERSTDISTLGQKEQDGENPQEMKGDHHNEMS